MLVGGEVLMLQVRGGTPVVVRSWPVHGECALAQRARLPLARRVSVTPVGQEWRSLTGQ